MFCRSCGKQIDADSAFCRYCGTRQEQPAAGRPAPASSAGAMGGMDPVATDPGGGVAGARPMGGTLESRLRHLFPRHHLQDEFMHLATIVAFVIAIVGFIFGFLSYALPVGGLAVTWLLFAIALLLFLMLRESTLSHVRSRGAASGATVTRYHAERAGRVRSGEGAIAESSPPSPEAVEGAPEP